MNRHMYKRQQEKNCLMHHGILGQKWGIRRYQNEDGTMTEEGKRRYNRSIKKALIKDFKEKGSRFTWDKEESKHTQKIAEDIDKYVSSTSNLKELGSKSKKLLTDINDEEEKFWDSKEVRSIMKKIEDDFEKEYGRRPYKTGHNYDLNDIELMNFDDEKLIEAKEKWTSNNKKLKKIVNEKAEIDKQYHNECERLVNSLVSDTMKGKQIYVKTKDGFTEHIPFDRLIYKRVNNSGQNPKHLANDIADLTLSGASLKDIKNKVQDATKSNVVKESAPNPTKFMNDNFPDWEHNKKQYRSEELVELSAMDYVDTYASDKSKDEQNKLYKKIVSDFYKTHK